MAELDDEGARAGGRRAGVALMPAPGAASEARSFVTEMLEVWECDDPDRVAQLLTSEVVTNAVRHATEAIELRLSLTVEGTLMVETIDNSPGLPVVRRATTTEEGGRGMLLVATLARRWGVRPINGHKVVWFEVAVLPR